MKKITIESLLKGLLRTSYSSIILTILLLIISIKQNIKINKKNDSNNNNYGSSIHLYGNMFLLSSTDKKTEKIMKVCKSCNKEYIPRKYQKKCDDCVKLVPVERLCKCGTPLLKKERYCIDCKRYCIDCKRYSIKTKIIEIEKRIEEKKEEIEYILDKKVIDINIIGNIIDIWQYINYTYISKYDSQDSVEQIKSMVNDLKKYIKND